MCSSGIWHCVFCSTYKLHGVTPQKSEPSVLTALVDITKTPWYASWLANGHSCLIIHKRLNWSCLTKYEFMIYSFMPHRHSTTTFEAFFTKLHWTPYVEVPATRRLDRLCDLERRSCPYFVDTDNPQNINFTENANNRSLRNLPLCCKWVLWAVNMIII